MVHPASLIADNGEEGDEELKKDTEPDPSQYGGKRIYICLLYTSRCV